MPNIDTSKMICPGCGCEPEVREWFVKKEDKSRVGFVDSCGAHVLYGVLVGYNS